jgi:hypothetical protein
MTRTAHFRRSGFVKPTFFSNYFTIINFSCTCHECACTTCIWECQSSEEKGEHVRFLTALRISETFHSVDGHTHWMFSSLRKYPKETSILWIIPTYFKSSLWLLCKFVNEFFVDIAQVAAVNIRTMQNGAGKVQNHCIQVTGGKHHMAWKLLFILLMMSILQHSFQSVMNQLVYDVLFKKFIGKYPFSVQRNINLQ